MPLSLVRPSRILIATAALLAGASTAEASVQIGPDLTVDTWSSAVECNNAPDGMPCSFMHGASGTPAFPTAAPVNGVITRFRYRAACCGTAGMIERRLTLRVFKPGPNDGTLPYPTRVGVRTGNSVVVPAGAALLPNPFEAAARLRIDAGEQPGLEVSSPIGLPIYNSNGGTLLYMQIPGQAMPDGTEVGAGTLPFNVVVEPDADGDGYGDETQDCLPTDPTAHEGNCAPPVIPQQPIDLPSGAVPCSNCAPPNTAAAPILSIPSPPVPAAVRVTADGRVLVPISCPPGPTSPCKGTVYVELPAEGARAAAKPKAKRLGQASFSVAPGAKKALKVKLSRTARTLPRKRRLVRIRIAPQAGKATSISKRLTFGKRPARAHRR